MIKRGHYPHNIRSYIKHTANMIQYMTLDDLLLPDEDIRYRHEIPNFKVSGELIVTDKRIIFHKQNGLIFKKDIRETIGLSKVSGLKFKEKGRISEKGLIC